MRDTKGTFHAKMGSIKERNSMHLTEVRAVATGALKLGQEELPHVQGQGQWPRVPGCDGAGTAEKSYPSPRSGVVAERSCPASRLDSTKEHSWGSN